MGMAFKGVPATDDLRGAMSLHVLAAISTRAPDAQITLYDPVCTAEELREVSPGAQIAEDIEGAVTGADIAIIANNHPVLATWRPRQILRAMAPSGFIYDYWNHFSDLRPYELGPNYFAVGNTGTREMKVHA